MPEGRGGSGADAAEPAILRRTRTLAGALAARGEEDKAIALLEQHVAVAPGDAEACYLLGGLYERRKDGVRAAELLAAASRAAPGNLAYLLAAAEAGLRLGRREEAARLAAEGAAIAVSVRDRARLGHVFLDAGVLDRAEELFRAALDETPADIESALGLSRIIGQRSAEAGIAFMEEFGARLDAPSADVLSALGCLHQVAGDHAAARACFEQAIGIDPVNRIACQELARYLSDEGRYNDAVHLLVRFLDHDPTDDDLLYTTVKQLQRGSNLPGIALVLKSLFARGNRSPWARLHLADALDSLGSRAEALALLDGFVEPTPPDQRMRLKLAEVYAKCGRRDRARAVLQAFEASGVPRELEKYHGHALLELGEIAQAVEAFRRVVARDPGDLGTLGKLSMWLGSLGRHEDALAAIRRASRLQPDNLQLTQNLAMTLLAMGRFEEGFHHYMSVYRRDPYRQQFERHRCPSLFDVDRSSARRLLAWSDQGLGDQLIGLLSLDRLRAEFDVTLALDPRLRGLLERANPGIDTVLNEEVDADPSITERFDAHLPVSVIPRLYLRSLADIRPVYPLLAADPGRVEEIRAHLRAALGDRPVVGLSWRSANFNVGRYKSTRLADWAPILRTPDVAFVNLQYGDADADIDEAERVLGVRIHRGPDVDRKQDLEGLVALMECLDAVVSTSNTNAHLAGVLRRPSVTMLSNDPGRLWYWFNELEASPWYPGMRFVRQSMTGEWAGVFEEAARQLAGLLGRG
jgi:tetratricopeptide (TPR) repeat protein